MLFPLKLNAFERYMWADDRPTSPMSSFVRVLFSGQFDKAAFVAALEAAVRRHPLLHARITGRRERALAWVLSPNPAPWFDCAEEGAPMRFPNGPRIDLREENGLRVWVRTTDGHGEIRFQFHHACCDGLAMNQFIEDVFCAYDHQRRGSADAGPAFRPLDPNSLRRRHRFGAGWRGRVLHGLAAAWGAIIGPPLFFLARPVPLHSPRQTEDIGDGDDDRVVPELLTRAFDGAQLDRLLATARQNSATLNDLLIRDLFLAMQTWNDDSGREKQLLRLMIPFDLRGPEHDRLPAANVMGMVNMDRRFGGASRWTAPALLESIRNETRRLKAFRVAAGFSSAMAAVGKLAGGMQKAFQTDRCLATVVLSNFGMVLENTPLPRRDGRLLAGGLAIEAVAPAPPVRMGSGISCALSTYAHRLSLTMHYDRRGYSSACARRLLAHIAARIEQTAGPASEKAAV